jgi:putative transposase
MARENRSWGYDRVVGALANLGHIVSDQTVGNVLRRHGLPPAPERKRTTTWVEFIRTHLALLAATDFFTVEVLTSRGLVTYDALFFIHLESRRVDVAGITAHPDEPWMEQIARNVTMDGWGILCGCRYLLHDRDTKYSAAFRAMIESAHRHLGPARPQPKFECAEKQHVVLTWVISLSMIVCQIVVHRPPQWSFAKGNNLRRALGLD